MPKRSRLAFRPARIVAMGESLGTGVAIDLAARHQVGALVLDSPYSSIVDVAAAHYWMFPVRLLMRDQFRSDEKIGEVAAPVLMVHGTADATIPIRFGEKLFALAKEPKDFLPRRRRGPSRLGPGHPAGSAMDRSNGGGRCALRPAGPYARSRDMPVMGHLVRGIDGDRPAVGFHRLDLVVLLLVGDAEARPGVGVVGVDVQRGVEVLDRRVIFAGGEQALAARLIGSAGERIAVDRIVEIGDRLRRDCPGADRSARARERPARLRD